MKARTAKAAETALTEFSHFLKNKFNHVEPWTDYYVCNVYYHDDNCVGSHSDSDVHWGAVDGESVILSYTYEQAGIMLVYPSTSGEYHSDGCLMDYCWTTNDIIRTKGKETQLIENSVIEAILLRPNSMLVMGFFFKGSWCTKQSLTELLGALGVGCSIQRLPVLRFHPMLTITGRS